VALTGSCEHGNETSGSIKAEIGHQVGIIYRIMWVDSSGVVFVRSLIKSRQLIHKLQE
jgi:uncharacterized protein YcfL